MALSGLVLAGFVLGHMSGNLLMFEGPAAINSYAAWLHANKGLLWGARIVLILSTIMHVYAAIWVKGTIRAMTRGTVTESWAKTNHALWHQEVTKGR